MIEFIECMKAIRCRSTYFRHSLILHSHFLQNSHQKRRQNLRPYQRAITVVMARWNLGVFPFNGTVTPFYETSASVAPVCPTTCVIHGFVITLTSGEELHGFVVCPVIVHGVRHGRRVWGGCR